MSREQPVLDICALYACYRGHGKSIDRSDWFFDFRDEVAGHGENVDNNNIDDNLREARAGSKAASTGKDKGKRKGRGGGGDGCSGCNESGPSDGVPVDPTAGVELLARFEHASDQLASMGYVRPLKRRRRLDEGRGVQRRGKGKGTGGLGPKGAVTRLVFSYTMEDGAL